MERISKRAIIISVFAAGCLLLTSCSNSNNNNNNIYSETTTVAATTTRPKETTKPSYHMSESTAIKLAKDFLKNLYTKGSSISDPVTDLVVFGSAKCNSEITDDSKEKGYVEGNRQPHPALPKTKKVC